MINKQYFIVVLGDIDNQLNATMSNRMQSLGEVTPVTDNIYLLKVNEDIVDLNKLRSNIVGEEGGYCLVFRFNNKISFAWSLPVEKSNLFKQVVKEVFDESK